MAFAFPACRFAFSCKNSPILFWGVSFPSLDTMLSPGQRDGHAVQASLIMLLPWDVTLENKDTRLKLLPLTPPG